MFFILLKTNSEALISVPFRQKKYKIKNPFNIIGVESFFGFEPRKFTMKAFTNKIKVLKLSQDDFLKVLREKPEDYYKFCEIRDKIKLERNFEDLNFLCKIRGSKNMTKRIAAFSTILIKN